MSFTVGEVITDVREFVQDTQAPYRYSDAFLERKVNLILRRTALLRPDLFTTQATLTCVTGALQACPSDSIRIMDVLANNIGAAVKEVNQEVLDMVAPAWEALPVGNAENWMRYNRDPNRFYLYPSAQAGVTISIAYAKSPAFVTSANNITMPDAYQPCLVDGVCWLIEAVDAEHVESGRSKMFQDSYKELLTADLSARKITDTPAAGKPTEDVV